MHFFGVQDLDAAGLEKLHAISPIAGVHKGMPPFLCIHGTRMIRFLMTNPSPVCRDAPDRVCGAGFQEPGWKFAAATWPSVTLISPCGFSLRAR